jgi:hypothetical protein
MISGQIFVSELLVLAVEHIQNIVAVGNGGGGRGVNEFPNKIQWWTEM